MTAPVLYSTDKSLVGKRLPSDDIDRRFPGQSSRNWKSGMTTMQQAPSTTPTGR